MTTVTLEPADWARLLEAATKGPVLSTGVQDTRITDALKVAIPPPPPPPATSLVISATTDESMVVIQAAPAGTVRVHWAVMADTNATGVEYSGTPTFPDSPYPLPGPFKSPVAGKPVVAAVAFDAASKQLGGWSARVTTKQATPPAPPPSGAALTIAVDTSGWGGAIHKDLASKGVVYRRINSPNLIKEIQTAGAKVATVTFHAGNPLNFTPSGYGSELATLAKLHPEIPRWEVLNEPEMAGKSTEQIKRYVELLKATRAAFGAQGVKAKILASWAPTYGYGVAWAKQGGLPYVDEVAVHPYGGSSGQHKGLEGGRELVEQAHRDSGKPVAITEVGWPTGRSAGHTEPTGDSQQWTEAQQAEAITSFAKWCLTQSYITIFVYFCGVDYKQVVGSTTRYMWYGIKRENLSDKPAVKALAEACKLAGVAP